MSNKFYLSETAQIEYEDAVLWYEQSREGIGIIFVNEVEKLYLTIQSTPYSFPVILKKFRAARVFNFPYRIIFNIESDDSIRVVSIFHNKRRPKASFK